jgi:hypothetical protein
MAHARHMNGILKWRMARSLKYRDLSFITIIALVVSGLQLLARVNRPPEIPRDSSHSGAGHDARGRCLGCHQRSAQSETGAFDQPHKRPRRWRADKLDCLSCHMNPDRGGLGPFRHVNAKEVAGLERHVTLN